MFLQILLILINLSNADCGTQIVDRSNTVLKSTETWIVNSGAKTSCSKDVTINEEVVKEANDLTPEPMIEEEPVSLYFATGSTKISSESKTKLMELTSSNDRIKKVIVRGYADKTGNANFNKKLSQQRALSVKNWLKANGYTSDKIEAQGNGIESSENLAGARRVEVEVVR